MSNQEEVQKRRSFPFGILLGCGCLTIILLLIGVVAAVIFSIQGKSLFVNFMNKNLSPPETQEIAVTEVKDRLNESVTSVGESKITITEAELQALLKNQLGSTDTYLDINDSVLFVFWPLDIGAKEPLYIKANLETICSFTK